MSKNLNIDDKKIADILLKESYISEEDFKKGAEFAKNFHSTIVKYLLSEELINKDLLGQAIAESFKVSYSDLNTNIPAKEQVLKIPEALAKKYRAVLFTEEKNSVVIATDNLEQKNLKIGLKKIFKTKKIILSYSLPEDIDEIFIFYRKTLDTRFASIVKNQNKIAPEIITEIFQDALLYRASDIHFEPQEKEVVIRFRVDGLLYEAGRLPKEHYENILNKIKVMANLRMDDHFSAQDGAIRYTAEKGVAVDMRISILPALDGEKIVVRLLAEYVKDFSLSDVGLLEKNQEMLLKAARKPFGMILVSGPTGSGKTTTLYSLVKYINKPEVNITTIEDPVEYKVVGVNQIQVNQRTELTFSKGLRSIVRQDPDIILVGEIRDKETAEIAVNAALTGHLLFSTFHANDAATSVPRLLDLGAEPFLLASTLELLISQRLARRICENCRYSYKETISSLQKKIPNAKKYFNSKSLTLYKGKGCKSCNDTGYHGRTAIFEFIQITKELEELILTSPSSQQIIALAKKQGFNSLFDDGLEKVKKGITTLDELLRVVPLDQ
ncbi:type II/IV secretion system protein [Candidatus Falkowbacteria bacterium]|jgi:type II secretory ATPase GspE/PulE/Tfp pilus assembly ATPase PilB-like protein|nr:type II/IV secretion system protein [Candidatus Falkowbacteria bacterium]MBT4432972.1 type II/IV secretion system protein [Candidatus Falkowbacteria bacterium]